MNYSKRHNLKIQRQTYQVDFSCKIPIRALTEKHVTNKNNKLRIKHIHIKSNILLRHPKQNNYIHVKPSPSFPALALKHLSIYIFEHLSKMVPIIGEI